ncbi:phenylalanine--tRNA ligase subunit alpha, partial [bacterium]
MIEVERPRDEALASVARASTTAELKEMRLAALGKDSTLSGLLKLIGRYEGDKKAFGAAVNAAKAEVETAIATREADLSAREDAERFERERIDVTLPGRLRGTPGRHLLQTTIDDIVAVLGGLGFTYAEGPDLEEFKYNFDVLNYPPDHPAMDDQDTFYIDDAHVLRTQGTALQG